MAALPERGWEFQQEIFRHCWYCRCCTFCTEANGYLAVLGLTATATAAVIASNYSLRWNQEDPRIAVADVLLKAYHHNDRDSFLSTKFTSFDETMAFFETYVLVSQEARVKQHYACKRASLLEHLRLQSEDSEEWEVMRDKIRGKFLKLKAMPEGPAKSLYHAKVRLTCLDVHNFLEQFSLYTREDIDVLCSKGLNDMTQEERMAVVSICFGTTMLINVAWMSCPI